jgi:hypothetical protein
MRHAPCPTNVSHQRADDKGAAIHRRERHPPSPGDKIGGRARLGWWWRAHWGGESVTLWRLFFRGASTMRSAFGVVQAWVDQKLVKRNI